MNNDIKFPIMDLTESTFQEEKVFFSDMEWDSELILNKKQIERLPDRIYIDSEGKILKVKIGKIEKINSIMSFLSSPKYKVDLLLINTGELFQMEDLKREILLKRNQMFHIYHNKLMTVDEFENKIVNARNYLEVIDIASFEDYKD